MNATVVATVVATAIPAVLTMILENAIQMWAGASATPTSPIQTHRRTVIYLKSLVIDQSS